MSKKKDKNRRYLTILFCVVMMLNLIIPVQAATGVPKEVLDAANSVVFVGIGVKAEEFSSDEWTELVQYYPEYIFDNSGFEYVLYSSGSGFVIKNENGEVLIATNNHVVQDNLDNVFVWLTQNQVAHAEVVFAVPEKDLSVIRIRETISKKPVPLAMEDAQRGDAAYAVGFPGAANTIADGIASTSEEAIITDGIISAVRSATLKAGAESTKLLLMNVSINHGNSGGPLFDLQGNVVGVNTLGFESTNGAIAVSELWSLLDKYDIDISAPEEIKANESVKTASGGRMPKRTKVLLAAAVIVCAALLIVFLWPTKNPRRPGFVVNNHKETGADTKTTDWHAVTLKSPEDMDITISSSRNGNKSSSDDQSTNDYFMNIRL